MLKNKEILTFMDDSGRTVQKKLHVLTKNFLRK